MKSLMISPFAKQMDQCLVYLDEAHTRGTDLKLPANYRAAVTVYDLIPDEIFPVANLVSVHADAEARKRSIGRVLRVHGS